MDDLDNRIGASIRAEREARHWSLTDLAQRASVSRAMIHKIERGDSSPTANLLGKLSGAFGLSMSALLARAEAGGGRLTRRAEQPLWTDPESGYLRRQVSHGTEMPVDVVEVTLPPAQSVAMPSSAYAFIRQMIWVQSGHLTFDEGETRHELHDGDCLHLGPPADCVFRNDSDAPVTYVVVVLRGP